jgi:hypothetical protein
MSLAEPTFPANEDRLGFARTECMDKTPWDLSTPLTCLNSGEPVYCYGCTPPPGEERLPDWRNLDGTSKTGSSTGWRRYKSHYDDVKVLPFFTQNEDWQHRVSIRTA